VTDSRAPACRCRSSVPAPRERCGQWRRGAGEGPVAVPCSVRARKVPELDFAAVRPGFVAACMVEAARARDGRRDRSGRPERCPPRCRAANGNSGRCPPVGARRSAARRVAAQGSPAAVPYPQKPTNGAFYPGGGKRSRRCSARCGYHSARVRRRAGPGIDYFE